MEVQMATWKLLLIIFVSVLVLAPIIGNIIGKQIAKRKNTPKEPVLNKKQRILYTISFVLGVVLITTGILWPKKQPELPDIEDMEQGEGMFEDGGVAAGEPGAQDFGMDTAVPLG